MGEEHCSKESESAASAKCQGTATESMYYVVDCCNLISSRYSLQTIANIAGDTDVPMGNMKGRDIDGNDEPRLRVSRPTAFKATTFNASKLP